MADLMQCPTCGAPNQQVGKFCEQCGAKVEPAQDASAASAQAATPDAGAPAQDASAAGDRGAGAATYGAPDAASTPAAGPTDDDAPAGQTGGAPTLRFVRMQNGVYNQSHAFEVPPGSQLLVGRADPSNGVFPEVDVTMWSQRVQTPEGALYTIHRKQCIISRDDDGRVWLRDYPDYLGDTLVSPTGTSQFHTIPSLSGDRESNSEGAVALVPGDRILMGQGEGMLIFQLVEEG